MDTVRSTRSTGTAHHTPEADADRNRLRTAIESAMASAASAVFDAVAASSSSPAAAVQSSSPSSSSTTMTASAGQSSRGRHSTHVDIQQLQEFLDVNLSITRIGELMKISRPTVRAVIRRHGLHQKHFASINDSELDNLIKEIIDQHPAAGEVMVKGHLRSRGIFIQRSRLRSSLNRVNAEGRAERKLTAIHRRVYFCPSPNYVWHLDGTHKLIRWRFVVHVGIDGYSRLVTFCQCSADNKAQTVLNLFKKAEEEYGLPLRVRTDFGVENVRVWQYMYEKRRNSNAVMVGSSVHNQRVERFHRDANMQVINTFYNEFMRLEEAGLLNPLSEADVFCLHLVYLSAINERLTEFIQAHNNHSLSTEHNWTPLQLFRMNYRLFQLQALDPSGSLDLRDIVEHSENNVSIPPIAPLPLPLLRSLRRVMQRNMQCDHFSLYCACVRFIRNVASP